MDLPTFLALLVFLFPLAFSPGPGNGFFAALGARGGLAAAWPALAGYHVATFVVTAAIGLGIGLAIITDPDVARVMRIAGALYVGWLGLGFLRAAASSDRSAAGLGSAAGAGFRDGAVILVLNPKAYLIIGLLFTQFLEPGADQAGRVLALSLVFTLNNLVAFVAWTLAGIALARLLARGASGRSVDAVFGACLVGVCGWMLMG